MKGGLLEIVGPIEGGGGVLLGGSFFVSFFPGLIFSSESVENASF